MNINKKPVEIVYELKDEYKIPSFEKFMKDYKVDEKVNYADLGHSSIGDNEGCGPNPTQGCVVMPEVWELYLDIKCLNWQGNGLEIRVRSVSEALQWTHRLEDGYSFTVSSEVEKKCAVLIREVVAHKRAGNLVFGYVRVKGKFWGSYEWSYRY